MNAFQAHVIMIGNASHFKTPTVKLVPLLGLVATGVISVQDQRNHDDWSVFCNYFQGMR